MNNRARFGEGYRDAIGDRTINAPRDAVEFGPPSPDKIIRDHDPDYYEGYIRGARDWRLAKRTNAASEQDAWRDLTNT